MEKIRYPTTKSNLRNAYLLIQTCRRYYKQNSNLNEVNYTHCPKTLTPVSQTHTHTHTSSKHLIVLSPKFITYSNRKHVSTDARKLK